MFINILILIFVMKLISENIIMKTITTQRAEKIARNINAMDVYFEYSDDFKVYKFWNGLRSKLFKILETLTKADKDFIKTLCKADKAKYFNLI